MSISVVILAKNEAEMLGESIETLKPLNPEEIIVVDDESSDDTASIAQFKGAKIITHKKKDFAEARNFGLTKVESEWVLYVDADERVSKELAREINHVIQQKVTAAAYSLPRVNYYLGKKWPHTEQVIRLFQKKALTSWRGELHESPNVEGEIYYLHGPLFHYTHRSLSEMVENTIVWSGIEAKLRFDSGHPPVVWWRIPRVMMPTFFDYYIKQGGWKVGAVGLIESIYQTFSIFITYARLWEMQNKDQISIRQLADKHQK